MNKRDRKLTRRRFLGRSSRLALFGVFGLWSVKADPPQSQRSEDKARPTAKSRVILIRREDVLGEKARPNPGILHAMLNEAVTALLGAESAAAAWKRLVEPSDVVGIKSNVWRYLPTPRSLENAIRDEVVAAGVKPANVSVDDRGVRGNPVFQRATALINVRPLRTHHWSGLGTLLKNYIMFVPHPPDYHADACAPLGALWKLPGIEGKTRLNILVMLTPQFHTVGPHSFSSRLTWPYRGLLVGTDPVAVDAIGARIIEAKRLGHFRDRRPIAPRPHHIELADTHYGLGNSAPERIDLVRLGWRKDSLV